MIENSSTKWYPVDKRGGIRDAAGLSATVIAKILMKLSDKDKIDIPDTTVVFVNGAELLKH